MDTLINEIKNCTICTDHLALGPRPVFAAHPESKVVIIGQAPGTVVHQTGIPWDDQSGKNLRNWLGVDQDQFYNPQLFALIPMGFCYPGKGKSGDLPPRPECAPKWHELLLQSLINVQLTLLIGGYAQNYYLPESAGLTLTARVQKFEDYLPDFFTLPHPSPRNNIWQAKNPWFQQKVLPALKKSIQSIL